ncbi:MAG: helix-turn-helix transcriptional regulator [Mesorhizobium sp.]|nr:MAG: helix-turn-helix transcriptional regulator [Mesorhizobium sp.]TJV49461.1 MAG: helix-turn-helix transcriptional regulator [Mesorhizobium sp.]
MRFVSKAFYAGVQGNNWATAPSLVVETARGARQGSSTDESIAMIGLACGFADQSHLTRVFRANVGTTTSAWRRKRRH